MASTNTEATWSKKRTRVSIPLQMMRNLHPSIRKKHRANLWAVCPRRSATRSSWQLRYRRTTQKACKSRVLPSKRAKIAPTIPIRSRCRPPNRTTSWLHLCPQMVLRSQMSPLWTTNRRNSTTRFTRCWRQRMSTWLIERIDRPSLAKNTRR